MVLDDFEMNQFLAANFDKLLAVAACAGYSLKDQLKAQRQEKSHGAYSVRSAINEKVSALTPTPCANAKSCGCSEEKSGNPCSTKTPASSCSSGAQGPRSCSPVNKDPKCEFDARSPVADQLTEFKKSRTASIVSILSRTTFILCWCSLLDYKCSKQLGQTEITDYDCSFCLLKFCLSAGFAVTRSDPQAQEHGI